MEITNKIIENHGLKQDEYKNIKKLLKRDLFQKTLITVIWVINLN